MVLLVDAQTLEGQARDTTAFARTTKKSLVDAFKTEMNFYWGRKTAERRL